MSEVKDKLITAENLKNAYDDNKRAIGDLRGDLVDLTNSVFSVSPDETNIYGLTYSKTDNGNLHIQGTLNETHSIRQNNYFINNHFHLKKGEKIRFKWVATDGTPGSISRLQVGIENKIDFTNLIGFTTENTIYEYIAENDIDIAPFVQFGDIWVGINLNATLRISVFYVDNRDLVNNITIPTYKAINPLFGKTWCVCGDSISTHSWRALKNYDMYISEVLGIKLNNIAQGGIGYKNSFSDSRAFYHQILYNMSTVNTDILTIMGGINDVMFQIRDGHVDEDLGTVNDTSESTTIAGYVYKTIELVRSRKIDIHMGIISPIPSNAYPPTVPNNKMEKYCKLLEDIAKKESIPYLDLYHSSNLRPWETKFNENYFSSDEINPSTGKKEISDGIHPNAEGHKFIYKMIMAFIEKL